MIVCRNVSLKYGKKNILNELSFTAMPFKITVILGKNGCGKSTLFKALVGNMPYEGSIKINSCEICSLRSTNRAKLVAMMPQSLAAPDISVRELVSFGRQPYTGISGVLTGEDREKVEQVMKAAEIYDIADRSVKCISGGERQKAYFAMMLAQETPVLLLDEPSSHLDAEYTKRLSVFLRSAADSGKTVIVVMHDINHALSVADNILLLSDNKMIFCGETSNFINTGYLETIFGLDRYECLLYSDINKNSKSIFL